MKKILSLLTLLIFVGGVESVWAEDVSFTIANKTTSGTDETSGISYEFSGPNVSAQSTYTRIKKGDALTIYASSAQITGISFSFVSGKGTKSTNNLVVTSGGGTLTLATDGSTAATWSGTSSSVTITDDATNGRDIDINGLTVTYTTTSGSYKAISVEDLRIKHDAQNPTRTLGGFTLTTSNWKAYNENATSYKLLHSDKSSGYTSSLSIALDQTNIDAGAKITQVVLVGEANTFSGVEVDAENNNDAAYTQTTTGKDQIVWTNTGGATTATIKLKTNTADARPSFSQIWIYTNKDLTY